MQCVILAGGLGTRMRRFTEAVPKAMIPVRGEPFVRHQLRRLAGQGISDIVIATGYRADQIDAEVRAHTPPGVTVRCVPDGPQLLGTGGCVRRLVDLGVVGERFLLTYGDSYLRVDHQDVWRRFDARRFGALMVVSEPQAGRDAPNARIAGDMVAAYRKGDTSGELHVVDHGLSLLTTRAVASTIAAGTPSDIGAAFECWAADGELQAYLATERYLEIGSEAGLTELEQTLLDDEVRT